MEAKPSSLNKYLMVIISLVMILAGFILLSIPILVPHMNHELAEFIKEVGRLFVPIGAISLIYEYILRGTFVEDMRYQLAQVLNRHLNYAHDIREAGILGIHERLPISVLCNLFNQEQTSVRILTTWIHEYSAIAPALRKAVQNGARVEILMLEPTSLFVRQRSLDLGYDEHHGATMLNTNLKELHHDFATPGLENRVEVRLYDCLPSLTVYMSGETALVGHYPHHKLGTQAIQLEVQGLNRPFGKAVLDEFETLWKLGKPTAI